MQNNTSYQERLWRREAKLTPAPLAQVKVIEPNGSFHMVGMNRTQRHRLGIRR